MMLAPKIDYARTLQRAAAAQSVADVPATSTKKKSLLGRFVEGFGAAVGVNVNWPSNEIPIDAPIRKTKGGGWYPVSDGRVLVNKTEDDTPFKPETVDTPIPRDAGVFTDPAQRSLMTLNFGASPLIANLRGTTTTASGFDNSAFVEQAIQDNRGTTIDGQAPIEAPVFESPKVTRAKPLAGGYLANLTTRRATRSEIL
jgi:hypothetical protein